MGDSDKTARRIIDAETQEQLQKTRDSEIARIMKIRLVIQELRRMEVTDLDMPDLERALKMLRVGKYLRLGSEGGVLLNLDNCCTSSLSYSERKALRQKLVANLQTNLKPIAQYGHKLYASTLIMPPQNAGTTVSTLHPVSMQILCMEKQQRTNLEKLAVMRNRKCAYLKASAELKMGPYLTHELELLYSQERMNQIKANVLRGFFINEFVSRTEHSLKAIKEVEGYINGALEQSEEK